jgi:hypothetical protein
MKTYGWVKVQGNSILTMALDGGEWWASHHGCFTCGKEPTVPIGQEVGGATELVWLAVKICQISIKWVL